MRKHTQATDGRPAMPLPEEPSQGAPGQADKGSEWHSNKRMFFR
ncbi:hypothetical protein CSB93_4710 [Pseudomonas paraeruginosa]|uniref:Uncharacterized protein n=1 Tax=Pseudomonas paraeruginosa TaxID=2994495 RepID=A0A2R3IY49_9PSED|nr:hypothetical protein CSB93_4710 [Pseudomonas paraeruginosa]AWE90737.1 hypothetical protein CSC28_3500 [Pseudomonas paraeruginosa]